MLTWTTEKHSIQNTKKRTRREGGRKGGTERERREVGREREGSSYN